MSTACKHFSGHAVADIMSEHEEHASELGTHAHWQDTYERELADHQETGHPGEIWCVPEQQHCLARCRA